ncbi:putative acyl-CoA dehydrogenase (plasmid) [Aromatoleum aromaticum EbN1]|uniref:Acyl-CoA dehydrogenase n=1 Tax=Aromatoleum aromaticum (strain DSM 19018 / LMG 30748 / EbN1) TaxID=76114 RepID=Q5NWN4_AROAE|nr:acyl-CoA dehydrogenase family protein [Aromatoleum aromaticum]CAI10530.1 putative acyl-CoA dehydrogenase [Aromatoleum aromaticum EbN1]
MFVEAIEKILEDHCSPAEVRNVESGCGSPAPLWESVAEAGFLELLGSDEQGGGGLTLAELFPVIAAFGRHAMPLPFAQSIVARALLAPGGEVPAGMLTLGAGCRRIDGRIVCPMVPFGVVADYVLVDEGDSLLVLPCAAAQRTPTGVSRSLVATLSWAEATPHARLAAQGVHVQPFSAAIHAALISGALHRVLEMTLQYANDRSQFGKSIGKFQAIQHQISVMAENVAAASMAAEAAFQGEASQPALLPSGMAKARASEAAVQAAAIAHAVHGAIGVTEEYDLQLYTRRLHEWRMAHGSEDYWNLIVGRLALAHPHPTITDFVRLGG